MNSLIGRSVLARAAYLFLALGVVLAFCALAGTIHAATLDDLQFEGSYGTGSNRAALVVDFSSGDGVIDSFAFEVWFNTPTITGFQLLNDVRNGTSNGFQYTTGYGGGFVQSMSYMGRQMTSDDETGMSLMYWTSNNAGTSWNLGWDPLADTVLSNNDSLGWLSQIIFWDSPDGKNWYSDPPESEWLQPVAPLKSAPEPSVIVLLLTGLAAAAWRWRRKR
ncbi:MAG: PEP-CTERM sorting domain-containing protein [Thermoguttaceae bacterium]